MKLLWLLLVCSLISVSNGASVPGFTGTIVGRDDDGFELAAYQYATTSNPDGSMWPKMVLYATNENDVIAAINYAKKNRVAIAVRTGGHQYSGASSTSGDNIQLDVSRAFLEFEWNNATGLLRVGVSWALRELDARMGSMGLFVPHGQCSNVHVGGHSQSGGYGSLCRGFGLFGDHIENFEIITADGQKRTVHRNAQRQDEKDLFYAVLGGSPGNFGVLTHITLRVHRNSQHLGSRGLKVAYVYSKNLLKGLLNVLVEMVNDEEVAGDWDYCITLASSTTLTDMFTNVSANVDQEMLTELGLIDRQTPIPVPIIIVFAEWANLVPGETFDPNSSSNWFKKMTDAATNASARTIVQSISPNNITSMTTLNANWVFSNVREFTMPFVKSGRVTDSKTLAQDGWVNFITDRIDTTISIPNSGVHLSGQFQLLGGKHSMFGRPPPGETAYSWRNSNSIYTLDGFYEGSNTSRANAIAFEQQIDASIGSNGSFCKDDRRVLWSSFGDHRMRNVWPRYYENQTKYNRLVRIKRTVDPANIFTPNEFCVGDDDNFQSHGKKVPPKQVTDADFAPKLRKQRELEFQELIYGKTQGSSGSSGSSGVAGKAAIAVGSALGAVVAVALRRKRNRAARPRDENCAVSSAPTTVTASV